MTCFRFVTLIKKRGSCDSCRTAKGRTYKCVRPRRRAPKARESRRRGGGVCGGGLPPPQLTRESGERRKLLQRSPGRSPGRQRFWYVLSRKGEQINGLLFANCLVYHFLCWVLFKPTGYNILHAKCLGYLKKLLYTTEINKANDHCTESCNPSKLLNNDVNDA